MVVNNNAGTATVADFPLTADGTGANDITGGSGTAAVTNAVVNAGSFALSKVGQAGYTASAWVCVGGTQNGANISLALGQSATCTITNDDQPVCCRCISLHDADHGYCRNGPNQLMGGFWANIANKITNPKGHSELDKARLAICSSIWQQC